MGSSINVESRGPPKVLTLLLSSSMKVYSLKEGIHKINANTKGYPKLHQWKGISIDVVVRKGVNKHCRVSWFQYKMEVTICSPNKGNWEKKSQIWGNVIYGGH